MKHKIFLGVIALFLLVGGWEIFGAFLNEHQYYFNMLANGNNWILVVMAIVSAMIPTGYILWKREPKLPTFGWMTAFGIAVFSLTHISVKDSILGGGFLLLLFNLAILLGLVAYFILGTTSLGTTMLRKWQHIKQEDRRWMLFSFAAGLAAVTILVHFLVIFKIFYPLVTWILFLGLGYFIWREWKTSLAHHRLVIEEHVLGALHFSRVEKRWKRIGIILFVMTIMYLLYGLNLSFIPYPTAWDANHAYMYIPKVWAENHGALGLGHPGRNGGMLWYSYIAFWFSLWQPLKSFVMAPDTIAVVMNYISGLFVVAFGLGLIKEVTSRVMDSIKSSAINKAIIEQISLYGGRIGILLWLTSGMGAFLVFVDNKTDLGVLAFTLVGILALFVWLRQRTVDKKLTAQFRFGLIFSAIFLGLAVASKPTAIIDVAIVTLLLIGIKLNTGFLVGVGFIVFAVMAKLQFLATSEFLDESQMLGFAIIGLVILLISTVYMFIKQAAIRSVIGRRLGYVAIWGAIILGTIFVIKGPYAIPRYIQQGGSFINTILLSEKTQRDESRVLFASTSDPRVLLTQTQEDSSVQEIQPIQARVCSLDALGLDSEDLYENTKRRPSSTINEDVGRYIGFGWRDFSHPSTWNAGEKKGYGPIKLGYRLARLIGPKDGRCFAFDRSAQAICEVEDEINRANPTVIQSLYQSLAKDSKGYELIADLWEYEPYQAMVASGTINPGQVRDELVALRTFYQSHSIKNDNGTVYIPYRFLVPMNAVFNRSLQNLSSYYTDIGFVWLLFMVLMLVAAVYGIVRRDSKLTNLALATIFGRIIRWLMAGGIVWYGIGLIIRTILVMAAFTKKVLVNSQEDDSPYLLTIFALFALWFALQFVFNFVRISSQGGGGPFAWYKMHAGTNVEITDTLQQTQTLDIGYGQQDVFDMQFPHYNKFINYVKDRDPADGVSIHGTYLQYFLHEQHNVGRANIYYLTSDGDTCLSYLRFKDEGWKHIVIDPNILSVVMGEGNESLMHRFFARRNAVDGTIEEDGEMTMLVKMRYDDYLKFFNSNNLGAKYAFTLDDATLTSAFGEMNRDQLVYLRAKLAVARFFPDAQELIGFIGNMLAQRIITGQGLGDLADIFGRDVNPDDLLPIAQQLVGRNALTAEIQAQIAELNQDERFVLTQYVNIYSMSRSNPQQYQQTIQSLLQQSLAGGSQIIILERNDAL